MVFGGRIYYGPDGKYGHGLGTHGLAFFDPVSKTWQAASLMPGYLSRSMNHLYKKEVADRKTAEGAPDPPINRYPIQAWYEAPFGGADAQGRAHYFVGPGSVYFDPRTRDWGQAEAYVFHAYPPDPTSNWTEGPRSSWNRRSLGATATGPDGRMYLVGGMGIPVEQRGRKELLDGLDISDAEANTWKRGASMKIARQSLAAAFGGDGKLYVFGGCACRGSIPMYTVGDEADRARAKAEAAAQRQAVAETEVYDPKTDTWSKAAAMPTPRMLFAAAPGADGKIYVIGGQRSLGGEPLSLVEVYDPAANRWSRGPSLRIARTSHTAVTTGDGTIWVAGGFAAAPGIMDFARRKAGDKGGPTTSVELLKTSPK